MQIHELQTPLERVFDVDNQAVLVCAKLDTLYVYVFLYLHIDVLGNVFSEFSVQRCRDTIGLIYKPYTLCIVCHRDSRVLNDHVEVTLSV